MAIALLFAGPVSDEARCVCGHRKGQHYDHNGRCWVGICSDRLCIDGYTPVVETP